MTSQSFKSEDSATKQPKPRASSKDQTVPKKENDGVRDKSGSKQTKKEKKEKESGGNSSHDGLEVIAPAD